MTRAGEKLYAPPQRLSRRALARGVTVTLLKLLAVAGALAVLLFSLSG